MKLLRRTFVLLVLMNLAVLYLHYNDAGKAAEGKPQLYDQEIEVVNQSDGLHIKQRLMGLPTEEVLINWPAQSLQHQCADSTGQDCQRISDDLMRFTAGETTEQVISYTIPHTASANMKQYNELFATMGTHEVRSTQLHIVDPSQQGGQWSTGLREVGHHQTDQLDYQYFSGAGMASSIAWLPIEVPAAYQGTKLSVYSDHPLDEQEGDLATLDEQFQELGMPHQTLIFAANTTAHESDRLLISPTGSVDDIVNKLVVTQIQKDYKIASDDRYTAELVTGLLVGDQYISPKLQEMMAWMDKSLTEQEKELFIKLIEQQTTSIQAENFNEWVEQVTDKKTTFFTDNQRAEQQVTPFFFQEKRQIVINGVDVADVAIYFIEGEIFYPAKAILRHLQVEARENEHSLYLEGQGLRYRFPYVEPFYVLNEKKFTTAEVPFKRLEDEFYFDEISFIRIFGMDIKKSTNDIHLRFLSNQMNEEES